MSEFIINLLSDYSPLISIHAITPTRTSITTPPTIKKILFGPFLASGAGVEDTIGADDGAESIEGLPGVDGFVSDAISNPAVVAELLIGDSLALLGAEAMPDPLIDGDGLGGVGELGVLEGVVFGFDDGCGSIKFSL